MSVVVRCPNGHRFKCKEKHIGKRARCPKKDCGAVFVLEPLLDTVPEGADDETLHMTVASRCPYCHSPLKTGAKFCTECWTDVQTGQKVAMREDVASSVPASVANGAKGGLANDVRTGSDGEGPGREFSGTLGLPLAEETRIRIPDFPAHYWAVVETMADAWYLFHKGRVDLGALHPRILRGLHARCPQCSHSYPPTDLAAQARTKYPISSESEGRRYVALAKKPPPQEICPSCGSREMVVWFDPFA